MTAPGGARRTAAERIGSDPMQWAPALAAAVAILVYINALRNGFVLDDEGVIVHNPLVHGASGIWRAFAAPYWPGGSGQYRPFVIASFAGEWSIGGGSPALFHALNLAWHAAATVLVYRLARAMLSPGASLIAALVFAAHPVHVEAVANVVGRSELVAACGVLAALVLHRRRSAWAAFAFAVALLAKENAIVLPALALAADVLLREPRDKTPFPYALYGAYAGVIAAWTITIAVVFRHAAFAPPAPFWIGTSVGDRALTMAGVVPVWMRLWFFPLDLSADYSPRLTAAWPDNAPLAALGAALAVVGVASVLVLHSRSRRATFAIVWMAIAVLPVSNVLLPTGLIVAERTLYLSSAGAVLLIACCVEWLGAKRFAAGVAAGVVVIAAGAARTWTRTPVWQSNRALFLDAAQRHPEGAWTHAALARVYAGNGGFDQALAEYRRSIALFDRDPVPWSEAIYSAVNGGKLADADSLVVAAEQRLPRSYNVLMAHAFAAFRSSRFTETLDAARRAQAAAPDSATPQVFKALAWSGIGVPDSVRAALAGFPAAHALRPTVDSLLRSLPPPVSPDR
ncbi:MAG TPA: hypothetical protein VE967_12665 [Gemmatimonadaceae bacterium]|nr:hypothetical protein [Gemmatimonadaceae bacterium]